MNLCRHKIIDNADCPICLQKEEAVSHILWECAATNNVWRGMGSPLRKWIVKPQDIQELWIEMVEKLLTESHDLCILIFLNIWH